MEQKEISNSEINKLTAEILILKQQTAQNIIEIGKRLISVRESLPHGEWGKWLEEKVDFTDRTARNFMRVASEIGENEIGNRFPLTKVYAILDLPSEEREDFISHPHEIDGQTKTVDEMTTRELQKAIKEKKEADKKAEQLEQSNKALQNSYNELSKKYQQEKNKEPETVEIEVDKTDYETINKLKKELENLKKDSTYYENKVNNLQTQLDLYKKDSKEYEELKKQMDLLLKQKDDIGRQIESATSLSGLIVNIEKFIKTDLAPIKYSRAILEMRNDDIVIENLSEILYVVEEWCGEIKQYINKNKNIINVEEL